MASSTRKPKSQGADEDAPEEPAEAPEASSSEKVTAGVAVADLEGLFERLQGEVSTQPATTEPDQKFNDSLEKDISDIFNQARDHRQLLIKFFIWYTCILSVFVLLIVFIQIFYRIYVPGADNFEVVPQWVLYLLVVGMFGQFIGLLTIVTTKVWTFEPFFNYYSSRVDKSKVDNIEES